MWVQNAGDSAFISTLYTCASIVSLVVIDNQEPQGGTDHCPVSVAHVKSMSKAQLLITSQSIPTDW
jgi:hypothetical protein